MEGHISFMLHITLCLSIFHDIDKHSVSHKTCVFIMHVFCSFLLLFGMSQEVYIVGNVWSMAV